MKVTMEEEWAIKAAADTLVEVTLLELMMQQMERKILPHPILVFLTNAYAVKLREEGVILGRMGKEGSEQEGGDSMSRCLQAERKRSESRVVRTDRSHPYHHKHRGGHIPCDKKAVPWYIRLVDAFKIREGKEVR